MEKNIGYKMELLQIITFSVKIFTLFTAIIVLSSYLIYKLKDRKRNKPYNAIPAKRYKTDLSIPDLQFNQGSYDSLQLLNAPVEQVQYENMQYENQQYENEQYDEMQYANQAAAAYQSNQPRSYGQRFKILNEESSSTNQSTIIERIKDTAPQKHNTSRHAQVFNIYDYYSNNNYEPMHKIKS